MGCKEDARVGIKRTPRVGTKRRQEVRSEEIEKVTSSLSFTPQSSLHLLISGDGQKGSEDDAKGWRRDHNAPSLPQNAR